MLPLRGSDSSPSGIHKEHNLKITHFLTCFFSYPKHLGNHLNFFTFLLGNAFDPRQTSWKAKNVNVDLGYRGHDFDGHAQVNIANRFKMKNKAKSLIKWSKRRSAIEPIFGHLKSDNRLERNLLKGNDGDNINAVLAACGFNLRKLYAVFLLPILKWLENRIMEKYFQSLLEQNYQPFGYVQNK